MFRKFDLHKLPLSRFAGATLLTALASFPFHAQDLDRPRDLRVNSVASGPQVLPDVAARQDGSFIAVWQDRLDGSNSGVRARIVDADGTPGIELQANSLTLGTQASPAVAVDAAGNFTVVWHSATSNGDDAFLNSIQGRRFAADGTALGPDFQVNSQVIDSQLNPRIAMADDGSFVVVWRSNTSAGSDDSGASVQARRFAADGTPLGPDFQVNTYVRFDQRLPDVAMAADGRFVIAWQSLLQDGWGDGVYFRLYDADGEPLTGETRANRRTEGFQSRPSVAMDDLGRFLVAWESEDPSSGIFDIRGRAYSALASPSGAEIEINGFVDGNQTQTSATDFAGGFFIAWQSVGSPGPDQQGLSVQGRFFGPQGAATSSQFQVNGLTAGAQTDAAASASGDGTLVVLWQDDDGQDDDIYATPMEPIQNRGR